MQSLSDVSEIICVQITLWVPGNVRPSAETLEAPIQVPWILRSWFGEPGKHHHNLHDPRVIFTADIKERCILAKHRIRPNGSHIRFLA